MSETIERKGPSSAGIIVGIMSVFWCMLLVGCATSATLIIGVVLIWAIVFCPFLMHANGKVFWDLKVDWATGSMGVAWWSAVTYLVIPGYYPQATWWAGLLLAVFTSIIIGKIARWWSISSMATLGGFLGLAIIWMNNVAMHRHAVLAVDTSQWSQWYYVIMVTVVASVAVVSITAVAQKLYQHRFCIEIPNNNRCK